MRQFMQERGVKAAVDEGRLGRDLDVVALGMIRPTAIRRGQAVESRVAADANLCATLENEFLGGLVVRRGGGGVQTVSTARNFSAALPFT